MTYCEWGVLDVSLDRSYELYFLDFVRGLDMSRFTLGKDDKEGSLYDLFAVANHSGTVNFGHYTAFGRLAEADQTIDGRKKDGLGMCKDYYSLRLFVFVLC